VSRASTMSNAASASTGGNAATADDSGESISLVSRKAPLPSGSHSRAFPGPRQQRQKEGYIQMQRFAPYNHNFSARMLTVLVLQRSLDNHGEHHAQGPSKLPSAQDRQASAARLRNLPAVICSPGASEAA
jgi:mevalonate pyrophosphate decarboxylase